MPFAFFSSWPIWNSSLLISFLSLSLPLSYPPLHPHTEKSKKMIILLAIPCVFSPVFREQRNKKFRKLCCTLLLHVALSFLDFLFIFYPLPRALSNLKRDRRKGNQVRRGCAQVQEQREREKKVSFHFLPISKSS